MTATSKCRRAFPKARSDSPQANEKLDESGVNDPALAKFLELLVKRFVEEVRLHARAS